MTILDVGANIGYYTLMASRLVGYHGKVFAFEPFPRNIGFLEKSVERNRFRNVIVFDDAVSDREGSVQLFLSPTAIGQHPIVFDKGGGLITVKSRTLDQFSQEQALERVDLIKIDAEGAEPMILSGGLKLLSKYRPHVIMEYDPIVWAQQSRLLEWVYDNYQVYQITGFPFLLRGRGLEQIPSLSLTNLFLKPRA